MRKDVKIQMARITFFIGNGFDINVGLDTGYKDFYKYYITENPEDKLAQAINSDYEYWSDLEEGLGKYTAKVTPEEEDSFWESEDKLEQALADYLELQMHRISAEDDDKKGKIAKIMQKSLNQFHAELPKEQKQNIDNIIANIRESITYAFVSFNYTNALDTCVKITQEKIPNGFGTHRASYNTYSHTIDTILHIHGTTTEEMIVGVNDDSQIANEKFRNNSLYCQWMIKSLTNQRFSQNKIQELKNIIDSSSIICIFGMSIGKTDKMWWEHICKWLKGNANRRLVIYVKRNTEEVKRITKRVLFINQNEVLDRMKTFSGLKDEEWNDVSLQIYIKFDTNIFNFNPVEEK